MASAELEALLAVQELDTAIDQNQHRRATLPERSELAAVDQSIAALGADLAAATASRDEIAGRQEEAEAELASTEGRRDAVQRRLYSGEVRASRDLQALAGDVDVLGARISGLEEQILTLMEEREPFDARVGELSEQMSALTERRTVAAEALARAEEKLAAELAGHQARRREVAAGVPGDLLATYDRLRVRRDGVGAARLVGDRCNGCHLTLPATELDRIRRLPPGEVVTCDQCGRILVPGG